MATQKTAAPANPSTQCLIGPARFSYLHYHEPKTAPGSTKPKYSVSLLIPKKDKALVEKIKLAIEAAMQDGIAKKFGGKKPLKCKMPLRDGDEEREDEVYKGHYFINASSDQKPGFVDKNREPITEKDEIYSGMYGRASVNFYAFDTNGNRGIACGLNNLQKLKDGDALSGRKAAEDDFKDDFVFEDDNDDLN